VTESRSTPKGNLGPELIQILIELNNALGKHAMYPPGHPMLKMAADQLVSLLNQYFEHRPVLALGIAPSQVIAGGIGSDPAHPVIRELAARLHRRNIGALKLSRGITRDELEAAIRVLAREEGGESLATHRWSHIRLHPLSYSQLELVGDSGQGGGESWASRLWLDLSKAALEEDVPGEKASDPAQVARAIDARQWDDRYGQRIAESLNELLTACRDRGGTDAMALQSRISKLITSMAPETLERLVTLEPSEAERQRFLLEIAQSMAVDAVLDLVQAAATATSRSISPALLQLLGKLAEHSEEGRRETRERAEFTFRHQVRQLIEGWNEAVDPSPTDYERTMIHLELAGKSPLRGHSATYECEPERILMMSLEVGVANASTHAAAAFLLHQGRTARLRELFSATAAPALAADILRHVATEGVLRILLRQEPLDMSGVELIVPLLKEGALVPLMDALAAADSTDRRDQLLRLLVPFGEVAGNEAVARVDRVAWPAQRNLLSLLIRLPGLPRGFSPTPFIDHPEARVRTEALRILFRGPATRPRAVCEALSARDPAIVRMGIFAAMEDCPPAAVPLLIPLIARADLDQSIRSSAVSAVASHPQPLVMESLLTLCYVPGRWFRGPRIAGKSPEVLAALTGLARHWPHHPRAREVLDLAAGHADPEIRAAVERKAR
jgi:hypothetical protein